LKRALMVLLIVFLLAAFSANTVLAAPVTPANGCPVGYELHSMMDHTGDPEHHHIGLAVDLNGDGQLCVKHLDNGLHVHLDNVVVTGL